RSLLHLPGLGVWAVQGIAARPGAWLQAAHGATFEICPVAAQNLFSLTSYYSLPFYVYTPSYYNMSIRKMTSNSWFLWALFSALFAALTAIFAKIGLKDIDSDFATLVRTVVILVTLAILVVATGKWQSP